MKASGRSPTNVSDAPPGSRSLCLPSVRLQLTRLQYNARKFAQRRKTQGMSLRPYLKDWVFKLIFGSRCRETGSVVGTRSDHARVHFISPKHRIAPPDPSQPMTRCPSPTAGEVEIR